MTSHTKPPDRLWIPLYKLYYIEDVRREVLLSDESLAQYSRDYSESERREIEAALEWGKTHPEYDFRTVLPNLPHSNEDIHYYIVAVLERIRTVA